MKQVEFELSSKPRGFHLVTNEVLNNLSSVIENCDHGVLHLFIRHTSASLTINENADPDVRVDMEMAINKIVPESFPYTHTAEGPDDMPAHIKASLMGYSLSIPISGGRLAMGTWQGIYLGEHRDHAGSRKIVATLY